MHTYKHFRTHRNTRRHASHDYSETGWYFVTVCCRNRRPYFGEIRRGVMGLSEIGCIAYENWAAIRNHTRCVELGAFIVMPNHVHGLIGLHIDDGTTGHAPSLQTSPLPRRGSLSTIVGSFKSAVTRAAHSRGLPFEWQQRFHDHVVRNDESLARIHNYIQGNPVAWEKDRYYR